MLTFDAVTTYAERHWEEHAQRCVETFGQHWAGMRIRTYTDQQLEDCSDWLSEFKQRHRHRPVDNYRFDAIRFAHKIAAIEQAYRVGTADVLVWIDADCVTHAPVDAEWLTGLLGVADFGYLKRLNKYSECGFMLIRRCQATADWLYQVLWLYKTDALFELKEWHDCEAIDHVRRAMGDGLSCVSLSGDAENTGHPLVNGPLGARLDHLKGKRKRGGRRSELKIKRDETYWHG